ncbi:MAG: colicin import membrane [Geobacteraceae bacterium]|nr:MAG: colicin import membrane [Geobacteraceae bacterium]
MVVFSAICHLTFYIALVKFHFTWLYTPKEEQVYYVDVVNLPVASPQAGSPTAAGRAPSPPPSAEPAPQEMKLPAKSAVKPTQKQAPAPQPAKSAKSAPETATEFEERIARLERETEAKHAAAALEALKKRTSGSGAVQTGMPGGTGREAGSDYASYVQSRLRDAFKTTIAYASKAPEVVIRLSIDRNGHIIKSRIERSSGDTVFEDAVLKAVSKAEKTFTPPPGGGEFEQGFIFKPQGVGKK